MTHNLKVFYDIGVSLTVRHNTQRVHLKLKQNTAENPRCVFGTIVTTDAF